MAQLGAARPGPGPALELRSLLGASRIRAVITRSPLQGVVLSILPLLLHGGLGVRRSSLGAVALVLKGVVIPRLLLRAMREAAHPARGRAARGLQDLVCCSGRSATSGSVYLATSCPWLRSAAARERMVVPTSFATVLDRLPPADHAREGDHPGARLPGAGERHLHLRAPACSKAMPFLVEVGVLLDLFVGVFVMGIIIHHISREFASINTERLADAEGLSR